MTQLTLDDAAAFAREEAIQRVHEGATLDERAIVRNALDRVIERGQTFTSEDVIAELGESYGTIREPRLLGAIILRAARQGRIIAGPYVTGQRIERHKAPIRQWQPITDAGR